KPRGWRSTGRLVHHFRRMTDADRRREDGARRFVHRIHRLLFVTGTSRPFAFVRRVSGYLHRPCTYVGEQTILTQTVFGHLLHLDARDPSMLPSLVARGYWEPSVTRALLRLLRPGLRVVEVGANVGWYSLLFAWRVVPGGSVTAFEANPRMVELLRRTLAAN